MVSTSDMLEAYFDCRRRKRSTASAVVYEMSYEQRLVTLRDRINDRSYQPGKSICFVVTRPKYREVFAASFEDRIVHHYISLRLEPLFESVFSDRTFNCRKDKGQLYGLNMLRRDLRECSDNFSRDCYIMKLDLQGFFMSIDKALLASLVDRFIVEKYKGDDIDDLRFVCRVVVSHHPEYNCERHSPIELWSHLPANKSLFTNGENKGIAIGNLFSQLFANFLLNDFDWYLESLGIRHHGRYVDDFYCIDTDKTILLSSVPKIREYLSRFGLTLNEKKFYFQHYAKGVEFIGAFVKPYRSYICRRTIDGFRRSIIRLNDFKTRSSLLSLVSSVNSYLGLMRQNNEYAVRRNVLSGINSRLFRYVYIRDPFETLVLRKKFRPGYETLQRLRHARR